MSHFYNFFKQMQFTFIFEEHVVRHTRLILNYESFLKERS